MLAMPWKITIEGVDDSGTTHCSGVEIKTDFDRLNPGEIGLSVEDRKVIMGHLQAVIVRQQCDYSATTPWH